MENDRWKAYFNTVFRDNLTEKDLEKMFLVNPSDSFAIYQIQYQEGKRDHRFLPMARLEAAGLTVERANYSPVYTADLPDAQNKPIPQLLEDIFYRFNLYRPEDFHGHSLSVSDVVALKINDVVSTHYVDRIGFQELHGFLSEQPLKNAEMMLEDDYGMIDGVINNGKREPERPSVVEQLRKVPDHKPKSRCKGKSEPNIE